MRKKEREEETNALTKTRTFEYDEMNNLVRKTDRNNQVIEYVYDDANRRTTENCLVSGEWVSQAYTWTYDEIGRLVEAADSTGLYTYTYTLDRANRVTEQVNDLTGAAITATFNQTYDAASRRTQLAVTVGATADLVNDYTYDDAGRTSQITQQGVLGGNAVSEKRANFAYNNVSRFSSIARYADLAGTQLVATGAYTYDANDQLTQLAYTDPVSAAITTYGYTLSDDNQITQFANSAHANETADYGYDDTHQLTSVDRTVDDEAYSYDDNGNRTNVGYTTGTNNQLTSDGTYSYTYDDEGNRLTKTKTGETTTYVWDFRNRLKGVTIDDGTNGILIDYAYDINNQLIARSEQLNFDPAILEFFVYDGPQILLSFDEAGSVTKRNLWGPVQDQLLFQEDVTTPATHVALTDHLNSVREIVDLTGTVIGHVNYDSFGKPVSVTGTTPDFKYTGKLYDAATGQQYNWHRWYDANVGRWCNEDLIGFDGEDVNILRYV